MMKYDVTIIGAGISGSLLAYNLCKYDLNVLLLDKKNDVAMGATAANSAIVHSGHDPKSGTLKCKYNLLGNAMYEELCKQLKVAFNRVGAFVVATCEEEKERLQILLNQCIERNIPHEVLTGKQAKELETNLSDNVIEVLSLPSTGIITPWEVCFAAVEEAMLNNVELKLDYEVKKIKKENDEFIINDEIISKIVINAAGVSCDDITNMLRVSPYKVEARKGEYYVLDHTGKRLVDRVIYPIPTSKGKGVLAVPTIHHNTLIGPNSDYVEDKDDVSTGDGLDYVKKEIPKTINNVPFNKAIRNFAGLRPHIDLNDFYIQEDDEIKNFIHVAGIESPGLSAAPAFCKDVVENIVVKKLNPSLKKDYKHRNAFIKMNELSDIDKEELIKKDPLFGKVVCRCENISEGEIKDIIERNCGAKTIRGVKMRCRPGMGRCQGSFCEAEVFKILCKYSKQDEREINFNKDGSNIISSFAKEDL